MYYMVGEVYKGGDFETLRSKAERQGVGINEDWWRELFRQVIEGIAFMHEQATIHCDIKEPNLMVKTTDFFKPQAVIIDLGVTVSMAAPPDGSPSGTPGYVPPETLETMLWFPKGDLFSMGVTMLQMVTNKVPCDSNPNGGIFQERCRNVEEVFLATRTRSAPMHLMPRQYPQLTSLVTKLLQKQRRTRPTASQALKDPWFRAGGDTTEGAVGESWALSAAASHLHPKNAFATVGLTSSFMALSEDQQVAFGCAK